MLGVGVPLSLLKCIVRIAEYRGLANQKLQSMNSRIKCFTGRLGHGGREARGKSGSDGHLNASAEFERNSVRMTFKVLSKANILRLLRASVATIYVEDANDKSYMSVSIIVLLASYYLFIRHVIFRYHAASNWQSHIDNN